MSEAERLRRHPFTRGLSDAQVESLAACARLARFPEGAAIFREGSEADAAYLILGGRVSLEQHVPGKGNVQLENLSGGDLLGLSWLFPGGRWTLDALAVEPTEAVALEAGRLRARMEEDAALGFALSRHVIQQLYQRLERVRLQRLDVYRVGP
ncbi:MAG TPA: cyclic nucleotide-binding domain-containing protein [Myxococcaceae bacterium]|nr:cyclic nucleotide-binding domain-containing protein [Myxococcaceae bacterium]